MFNRITDVLIIICLIALVIWASATINPAKSQNAQIVPLPTLCGPTEPFIEVMREGKFELFIHKEDDTSVVSVFINAQNDLVVALTTQGLTCLLTNAEEVEINTKALKRRDF